MRAARPGTPSFMRTEETGGRCPAATAWAPPTAAHRGEGPATARTDLRAAVRPGGAAVKRAEPATQGTASPQHLRHALWPAMRTLDDPTRRHGRRSGCWPGQSASPERADLCAATRTTRLPGSAR